MALCECFSVTLYYTKLLTIYRKWRETTAAIVFFYQFIEMNLSKESTCKMNLTSHHYKQATKRQINDNLSTAVKNSIKEKLY